MAHCLVCGFLMLSEQVGDQTIYTCPNQSHQTIGKANHSIHLSENLEDVMRGMGPNLDLILRGYQEKPSPSPIVEYTEIKDSLIID